MKRSFVAIILVCDIALCSGARALGSEGNGAALLPSSLAWERGHPERGTWSTELKRQFARKLDSFDAAMKKSDFCPRYTSLSTAQKTYVLATLAVGIAKFESNYSPRLHYGEPPPLGYDSIGLFQLSYEDGFAWCKLDRPSKSLENPIINIQCAVPEMARLAAMDKTIAAGSSSSDARGLARYWSVVRRGPKHYLTEIKKVTQSLAICH